MAEIHVLSSEVAALIAAGEVVERPSSVIKELVENAVDAGAHSIAVEISRGGIASMRVTDDGKGMALEDVPAAFLRHATSKIAAEEDLEHIITLGFRGEALHSIAAVSEVELVTKRACDDDGTRAQVSAGEILDISPTGCPVGTSITVRKLFFNTPARMKFLKKDSTEAGYIEDIVRKIALARPDISFRYTANGKDVFFTPGDGTLRSAVHAVYGKDVAAAMIEASYQEDGVTVSGLVGKSEMTRPNRAFQTFFVNGRCVINKSFFFALTEAYKEQIMGGRFPVAVLNITIDPSLCDVNVHPSKAEIKFANDKPVYDGVYWAAKNALYAVRDTRTFAVPTPPRPTAFAPPAEKPVQFAVQTEEPIAAPQEKPAVPPTAADEVRTEYVAPKPRIPLPSETWAAAKPPMPASEPIPSAPAETPVAAVTTAPAAPVHIIGQVFDTYIAAQRGEELLLIDQHAAHERLLYNRLTEELAQKKIDSQLLLMPVIVNLSSPEMAVFEEHTAALAAVGFDAEEFGTNTVKISMIPTALTESDIAASFVEILDMLETAKRDLKTSAQVYALYGVACKAAMKAGKTLDRAEQEALVRQTLALPGEVTCPHGRPVILNLTKKQIEKQFKRIL